ncbi:ABC transporter permease [Terrabacter sp. NPDC000476]|uniref:ABC transporter permease n=1 Tax=Terrabacter sp. NPDC000476 TaxID=3154258 RepID=UPI00332E09D2
MNLWTRAVRAELRKFLTTRLWWGMAIAVLVSGAAFALLFAFVFTSAAVEGPQGAGAPTTDGALAKSVFTGGLQIGYLLTLSIGVLTIGSEYRHQTITATFLAVPRRVRVMTAKVAALLVIGAFYGVLSLAGAVGAGSIALSAKGHAPFADGTIWRTLALSLLVLGLWALIGLGAGILIPNQVAALLISVAVAWIVEPVLGLVLALTDWGKSVSPYLPSRATTAMLDTSTGGFDNQPVAQLSWWAGALVLTAYAVAMAGLGTWRTVRADVS